MFELFTLDDQPLLEAGASKYQIAGPGWFFKWLAPGKYDTTQIDPPTLQKSLDQYRNEKSLLILDIEEMDLYGNRQHAIQQMLIASEAWTGTGRNVGWYGVIPEQIGMYWVAAEPSQVEENAKWRKQNDANYADLHGERLACLCPSIYAFYKPGHKAFGSWKNHATGMLQEAERLANGKPIYPFLWPVYHPSAEGGSTAIEANEWAEMVEHVASFKCVRGLVAWLEPQDKPVASWRQPLLTAKKKRDQAMAIEAIESKVAALKTEQAEYQAAQDEATKQKAELVAAIDAAIAELNAMKQALT